MNKKSLFYLSCFTSFSTVFLLAAGALVTSTGSGLAVPDWPLSYGSLFPPMVGGILFEHGHRLVAGWVLILTLVQAAVFFKFENRGWVRTLTLAMLGIVLLQALLGGLTVLLKLPPQVSIAHACLAQIFFSCSVFLTLACSNTWNKANGKTPFVLEDSILTVPQLSLLVAVFFFLQLLFGATMRHMGAGLAIPDFPLMFGGVIPPHWNFGIVVHFAHRTGAFILTILVGFLCAKISRRYSSHLDLVMLSGAVMALVFTQILLGAMVIWLRRPVPFTMVHLVTGALCFALSVSLFLLIKKHEEKLTYTGLELQGNPT